MAIAEWTINFSGDFPCRFCGKYDLDFICWAQGYHNKCVKKYESKNPVLNKPKDNPNAVSRKLDLDDWADRPINRRGFCVFCRHPHGAHNDVRAGSACYVCKAFSVKNGKDEDTQCTCRGPYGEGIWNQNSRQSLFIKAFEKYLKQEFPDESIIFPFRKWAQLKKKYGVS